MEEILKQLGFSPDEIEQARQNPREFFKVAGSKAGKAAGDVAYSATLGVPEAIGAGLKTVKDAVVESTQRRGTRERPSYDPMGKAMEFTEENVISTPQSEKKKSKSFSAGKFVSDASKGAKDAWNYITGNK